MHSLAVGAAALVAVCLCGCATSRSPVDAFYENDYAFAADEFQKRAARHDKNFALYACDLGESHLAAGDFVAAKEAFLDATMVMNNLGGAELRGLGSLVGPESLKMFKGDPFEKAMVDAANGTVLYALGDYENAAVGFRRALLADKNSKTDYQDDFGLAHYMLGKCLLRLGRVEDAKVAFRNAKLCAPGNPYVDLESTQQANFTILIDMGRAPVKTPSGVAGSIDVYRRAPYVEHHAVVAANGRVLGESAPLLDLYHQAAHTGRSAKDAIQTAKGTIKTGAAGVAAFSGDDSVRLVALLVAILFPAGADIRQCELLPGEVHVFHARLDPGEYAVELNFRDRQGRTLAGYAQRWYHIPVEDGKETFLYARSIPNRGSRQVIPAPALRGEPQGGPAD